MSVDYDSVLGIGRRFDAQWRVEDFLAEHTDLNEDEIGNMFDGGSINGMSIVCLNCYSGQDWFVGYEIGGANPEALINNVVDAHECWKVMFKGIEPRVIHAVKVW